MKYKSFILSGILHIVAILYLIWGILGIMDFKNLVYAGYQIDSDNIIYKVDKGSPADIAGMKVGDIIKDVIRENEEKDTTEKEPFYARGRSEVGEEREYVVERNGESLTLQFILGATTKKKKVYRVIYYLMGLLFVSSGLYTQYRIRSNLSWLFATFTVFFAWFFAASFPIGPYIGRGAFSNIIGWIIVSIELISLPVLIHFIFKYPPESNFMMKKNKQIRIYLPVLIILIFCWIAIVFFPGIRSISDQLLWASYLIITIIYFIWSLVILIRKFATENSEIRRKSGLNLMILGGCLGLPSIFFSTIISFITNDSTLSGGGYVFLLILAIPVLFMLAVIRQNNNMISN